MTDRRVGHSSCQAEDGSKVGAQRISNTLDSRIPAFSGKAVDAIHIRLLPELTRLRRLPGKCQQRAICVVKSLSLPRSGHSTG